MAFGRGELRRGLDVYAADYTYLGTIQSVLPGPAALPAPRREAPPAEPGFHGEASGPVPTEALGNRGPRTQSPAARYAADPRDEPSVGLGAIVVARWWGLRDRRTVPIDDILVVSLERVVLRAHDRSSAARPRRPRALAHE